MTTADGVTLVWYTTRPLAPGRCTLVVEQDQQERRLAAESAGARHRVRVDGLAPGQACAYRVEFGGRTLASARLRTAPPAGSAFAFLVFGDSGTGSQEQYRLAAWMPQPPGLEPPDFIVHTGDLVYMRGERSAYNDRFFTPYRQLLSEVNFWPSLGNHDVSKPDYGGPYFEVFELPENGPPELPPERSYWFDYGSARIAVIDSNADESALSQYVAPWLRGIMSGGPAVWKFAVLHHPPYTAGHYAPDPRVQRALVPVFEETGVDIVFAGHDHMYERIGPLRGGAPEEGGVTYIVSGSGGYALYEAQPPELRPSYVTVLNNARHSFTHVHADGLALRLHQVDLDGAALDSWKLVKLPPATAAAPALPTTAAAP
jgi:3',5'-cyclic AMP phosphodiesterase CpdA